MKPIQPTKLPLAAVSSLSLALGSATLQAQIAWDGGGGDSDYGTATNWAGDSIPGNGNPNGALIGSSAGHTVVYSTATSYTSSGTAKANSLLVGTGTDGVGTLTLAGDAGTLTFGGDAYNNAAWIGSGSGTAAAGMVTVSAGKLAITGGSDASINLGVRIGGSGVKSGTLVINGGIVEVGRRLLMGANDLTTVGTLTLSSGTLDMKRTGSNGEGDLGMIRLGNGSNTVNLDGGTAILSGFHTNAAATARSTIYFNGTTLRANANITDLIVNGATATTNANYRLKTGGLVVDTNTFNVTINDALTQDTGHTALLRKESTGILTITGAQANRTGTTTVNGGTLRVSGNGSLGSGATTVNGAGSVLDLTRNDTWGTHSASTQTLTIQSGGLVTNGTAVNSGYNTVQTLALDGGELRVTGTAKALVDGDLFKFEAYGIRDSITVTGTAASSITNPGNLANAGINIGGTTNLGGGVGSDLTIHVASAADLTVSAVLKNNYDAAAFNPLANGLVKTGDGTLLLSAVNRYTGPTAVNGGTLALGATGSIDNASGVVLGGGTFDVSAKIGGYTVANLTGVGNAVGSLTVSTSLAVGNSPGTINFESLTLGAGSTFTYDLTGGAATADLGNVSATLTIDTSAILDLVQLGTYTINDKFTLFGYETVNLTGVFAGLADGAEFTDADGLWKINYFDATAGLNGGTGTRFVTIIAIPEPSAALLGGLGLLALLRRRR